jgi:hypothetical protein
MTSRDHAKPVWVDLAAIYGRDGGSAEGIDIDAPAPGGLTRWLRTSTGGWVAVVNLIVTMTEGSTAKYDEQLIPSHALRPR